ncbi:hypothetical protein D3C80_1504100 [compost metagenome]
MRINGIIDQVDIIIDKFFQVITCFTCIHTCHIVRATSRLIDVTVIPVTSIKYDGILQSWIPVCIWHAGRKIIEFFIRRHQIFCGRNSTSPARSSDWIVGSF